MTVPTPITNVLRASGVTRDMKALVWTRVLMVAALLTSHVFDVAAQLAQLGIQIGPVGVRRIEVAAIILLWLAGRYGTSPLPAAPKP